MPHRSHAFEILYDAPGNVLDHSELFFSDLPGAGSRVIDPEFAEQLGDMLPLWEASRDLLESVCEWMSEPQFQRTLIAHAFFRQLGVGLKVPCEVIER